MGRSQDASGCAFVSRDLPNVGWPQVSMQVSPDLWVLHSFLLGGRWSSVVWLRGPQYGGRGARTLGIEARKHPRVRLRV